MQTTNPPSPFSCRYAPNLPELLLQLNCTIALTTYQAGKLIFISAVDENNLVQLPRTFAKAMGVALHNDKLAVATKNELVVLKNDPRLATSYPKSPAKYDALFMPRITYYTGEVDIHDIDWGVDGLWGVNTSFSTLCLIDEEFSFVPKWKPHFITELVSEDRCHLNGLAMQNGKPKYVTALGTGNAFQSWREKIATNGVVMDIESNEIVVPNIPMPHSPRLYDGKLFLLTSATGDVVVADPEKGTFGSIINLQGFVRGMARIGDYLFVGLSKLRQNSSTFKHLDIAKLANEAGIDVIHIPTASRVAYLRYQASVDEIYDVQILPNILRPGIVNTMGDMHHKGLSIPSSTFWAAERPAAI
ncbi:MAG: TIGR03032 family protein [Bacteroidota bacterium]